MIMAVLLKEQKLREAKYLFGSLSASKSQKHNSLCGHMIWLRDHGLFNIPTYSTVPEIKRCFLKI